MGTQSSIPEPFVKWKVLAYIVSDRDQMDGQNNILLSKSGLFRFISYLLTSGFLFKEN